MAYNEHMLVMLWPGIAVTDHIVDYGPRLGGPAVLSHPMLGMCREEGELKLAEKPPADRAASTELTSRQRARMADLSLLLDIILKTNSSTARKEFCRCGVLHQLQVRTPSFSPICMFHAGLVFGRYCGLSSSARCVAAIPLPRLGPRQS